MVRQMYLIGNWKMNQCREQIEQFFAQLKSDQFSPHRAVAGIAPQSVHLAKCLALGTEMGIAMGAQNCSAFERGAYTGEVSPCALKEMGATFTLVGHSERRILFGETSQELKRKLQMALSQGLQVIFCVGESREERAAGQTLAVLEQQLLAGLAQAATHSQHLVLAYEPIWAIGTGDTATPAMANEIHGAIRQILTQQLHFPGSGPSILYGGSVKPDNVQELLAQEHIDGALVGGASLRAQDFKALYSAVEAAAGH